MSTLFGSLSIALRSLLAQQGALEVTANNIANVNTPGYARRRAVLREDPAVSVGSVTFGTGVSLAAIESIRDRILELRMHQETQQQERLDTFLSAMRQVEALLNEAQGVGLQEAISKFFGSLQTLSANPSSIPLRQAVLTAGENLAEAFRRTAQGMTAVQTGLDRRVTQSVGEINSLLSELAKLNLELTAAVAGGQEAAALEDRRELLLRKLSGLLDIAIIDTDHHNVTVTTGQGTTLVAGANSFLLQTQVDPATGFQRIWVQGADITDRIVGGQLAGVLDARDHGIPELLADLDQLAAELGAAFNAQHRGGFDLLGAQGEDFFAPFTPSSPGVFRGAAAAFTVVINDPARLAASLDNTAGGNGNVVLLASLQNQAVVGGLSAADFYVNTIFQLGNKLSESASQLEAETLILRQLENQRASVSGVSLDEEAASLIRYQRAYEAAARVVAVVDELTRETIDMVR